MFFHGKRFFMDLYKGRGAYVRGGGLCMDDLLYYLTVVDLLGVRGVCALYAWMIFCII